MLAQILEKMWVDPEVLEALSDEQKKVLFLKMRQEQVRRWKAREEKDESEGRHMMKRPKKASSKQVRWLLNRDGDLSVTVIGEVDEFRSSKVLQNRMNNRLPGDSRNCIQTVDLLPGSVAQQLSIKDDAKLPLTDVNEHPGSPINQSSEEEEEEEDCRLDEDPKDQESGGSSGNVSELNLTYRPQFPYNGKPLLKSEQSDTERVIPQFKGTLWPSETSKNEGHMAQLRKDFPLSKPPGPSKDFTWSRPSGFSKPPIPDKPAHLQKRSTALVH